MAPAKGTKKAPKTMEKPIVKPISTSKKMKKKNYQSFSVYIYRVLKAGIENQNIGISSRSMQIMNNFVNDMLEKIATEASRLVANSKKTTMTSREIETAIKLIIPGELATHANIEAMKAVSKFYQSKQKEVTK